MMSREFVNPYTFIPLDKRGASAGLEGAVDDGENRLTGVITCKLVTKTALAIPDTAEECGQDEKKKEYPFFKVAGDYVIPGSAIRGPARNVFETLTNSCMSVTDKRLHSTSGMKKPGLLEKTPDGYLLHKATRYRVKRAEHQQHVTGDFVKFDSKPDAKSIYEDAELTESGFHSGWFLKVQTFGSHGKQNKPSVFEKGKRAWAIDKKYVDALEENIKLYVDNNENDDGIARDYQKCFKTMKDGAGQLLPVWYAQDGDSFQFAPSQKSRSVYAKKPSDFLGKLNLAPCKRRSDCCPACELFGFVSSDEAAASKVRFSDAQLLGEASTRWVFLPNLMEPRTSSFEFYLRNDTEGHKYSFTPETKGTQLAGRKYYWHHQKGLVREEQTWTDYNAKMEIVEAGSEFEFKVFFDEISQLQLNQLVFALSLGQAWDHGENMQCHKIGHGKPVGLGSVLIEVKRVDIRTVCDSAYSVTSDENWKLPIWDVEQSLSNVENVKKATLFSAIPRDATIDYPRKEEGGDIFAWFADNRDRFARGAAQNYCVVLPSICDSSFLPRNPKSAKKHEGQKEENRSETKYRSHSKEIEEVPYVSAAQFKGTNAEEEGIVVKYSYEKKYGFIEIVTGGDNKRVTIYFDDREWRSKTAPRKGQRVSFVKRTRKEGNNKGKPYAGDIQIIE